MFQPRKCRGILQKKNTNKRVPCKTKIAITLLSKSFTFFCLETHKQRREDHCCIYLRLETFYDSLRVVGGKAFNEPPFFQYCFWTVNRKNFILLNLKN